MPKHRVIDADGHVMETHPDAVQWRDAMGPAYRDRAPRHIPFPTGGGRMFLEGKIWFEPIPGVDAGVPAEEDNFAVHSTRPGMWDPHVRIEDMDLDGIDQAVLFGGVLALAASGLDDGDLALALCRAYNDWLAGYCAAYPDRLKGMCALPLQNPEGAAAELHRGVTELGLVGAHFPTNVHGRDLDDAALDPVYAVAQDLDVPVCSHGGYLMPGIDNMAGPRSPNQFYLNLYTFPFELMTAMSRFICGGGLDRFPRLRVGIMEGYVGWLPFWLNRMDSQYEKFGKQVPAKLRPSEYVESGRVMVTCDYDETTLPQVVDALGAGNILYASDYWHIDAKFPGTVEYLAGRDDLSGEAKGRILGENAAELFKL